MSEYSEWMRKQPKEFQEEILGDKEIGDKFFDENFKPITLDQLRELDEKHNTLWVEEN